jgi:hypothetical protein
MLIWIAVKIAIVGYTNTNTPPLQPSYLLFEAVITGAGLGSWKRIRSQDHIGQRAP